MQIVATKYTNKVGGCNLSKLDVDNIPGKDAVKAHRGKIGVITDAINSQYGDGAGKKTEETKVTEEEEKNHTNCDSKDKGSNSEIGVPKNPSATTTTTTSSRTNSTAKKVGILMGLKLYSVSDSPPTLAVRMALKYLGLEYEIANIDFGNGEQVSEEFINKSPQGEVPLLDDNDFILSESVAILQYLADKYKVDDKFYPSDFQERAKVNHRLAFHLSTYYRAIVDYMLLPLCYAYPRTEENLKKLNHALKVFNEILSRQNAAYVAGENVTIADLPMIMGCVCLEAMSFDISVYPKIQDWYNHFKANNEELWAVANQGLEELTEFEKNPPDLSHVNHPIHPTDKSQMSAAAEEGVSAEPAPEEPTEEESAAEEPAAEETAEPEVAEADTSAPKEEGE